MSNSRIYGIRLVCQLQGLECSYISRKVLTLLCKTLLCIGTASGSQPNVYQESFSGLSSSSNSFE